MLNAGYLLEKKYKVIKVLGNGKMGSVYLCKDIEQKKFFTIKEVEGEFKRNINLKVDMDFLLELKLAKKLNHRGISSVVDIFYEEDNLYIVQEYIEGQTLNEYVKDKEAIDTNKIVSIASKICDIMSHLERLELPVKYRYLTPSNIIITSMGKVVLTDVGISNIHNEFQEEDTTYKGVNVYNYIDKYDLRQEEKQRDINNIGRVMYFMTTGKLPSMALEPLLHDSYRNNVENGLKRIIQKCFEIDIKNRYTSVEELNKEVAIEFLKGKKEEDILITKAYNKNIEIFAENMKIKKSNNFELKRNIVVAMLFITLILATAYVFI